MAILFAFSSKSCDGSACPRCRSSATLYALLIPSSLSLAISLRFLNCALCFFLQTDMLMKFSGGLKSPYSLAYFSEDLDLKTLHSDLDPDSHVICRILYLAYCCDCSTQPEIFDIHAKNHSARWSLNLLSILSSSSISNKVMNCVGV